MGIQEVIRIISLYILGGLVVFQSLHYFFGGLRFWKDHPRKYFYTACVMAFWAIHGALYLTLVPTLDSYIQAAPFVVLALYTPPLLVLAAILFSARFRNTCDRVSLRWAIQSVEGPARIIAGTVFIIWFFGGMLPGYFAWIAGPGDIIAGAISFWAVHRLKHVSEHLGVSDKHWSAGHLVERVPIVIDSQQKQIFNRHIVFAMILVGFGILDFILAPASSGWSVIMGQVPNALGQIPLGLIPMLLVPQVFVLEIIAMRQLILIRRTLSNA
jgi:hypothetical protein